MTRLHLDLSHLREHKFKHSFQDSINPLCNRGYEVGSTVHFFIHGPLTSNEKSTFFSTLRNLDSKIPIPSGKYFAKQTSAKQSRIRQFIIQPGHLFYQLRDWMSHFL